MQIQAFGLTDIGKKRKYNEDSYLCLALSDKKPPQYLLAVADGIGGHSGGDIASSISIDILKENILLHLNKGTDMPPKIQDILEDSFHKANEKIIQKASEDKQLTGMGSTLVAAVLSEGKATISNIGDSRAYLIQQKSIQQVTLDHTWKAEQLKTGSFSVEEILNSPYKNMITQALGLNHSERMDTYEVEMLKGDYLFLCTDGLYSLLSDKEILKIFKKHKKSEKICRKLIISANKHGGDDNITTVIAQITE